MQHCISTMFHFNRWSKIVVNLAEFYDLHEVLNGVVFLGKYAQAKLVEFQEKEAAEALAQAKRQHHFDSNQRTCNMTVLSMLPSLRETLMKSLDSERLIAQLRTKPENKYALWEEIKVISFTRTFVAVYSSCMMVVLLRVQLNIIGGYMFIDNALNRNGTSQDLAVATPEVQQRYLATIQYLLGEGLVDLISTVQKAVETVVGSISLKQQLSLHDLQGILNDVRHQTEMKQQNGINTCGKLAKFMLPDDTETDQATSVSREDVIHARLVRETKDIIESSDFALVLTTCLDTAFIRLIDSVSEFYQPDIASHRLTNPNNVLLAMAKLIPVINGQIHTICADTPNQFVQELLLMDKVKSFAANVYEAFSQVDEGALQQ